MGKKDIIDYIKSLENLVPYWYMLHFCEYNNKSDYNEEINNWLTKLSRLEYNYFRPLVLVVLFKKNISEKIKCNILKDIERYIFINFRLGGYQATYSRHIYYKITHELYLNLIEADVVLKELKNISQLSDNNIINMNLGVLSTINKIFKNSGFYSWKSIRYFLYEYETYLVNKLDGVTKIIDKEYFNSSNRTDKVSIEHIFPQSESNEYWLKIFGEKYNLNQRNNLRGSIGNLIPLSLSINKKLQDDTFELKKKRYKIGSYSEMEIYNCYGEDKESIWDAQAILNRGLNLIMFMENRWNFKFENDSDRKKFLGLDFMIEVEDINKNVTEVINNDSSNHRKEVYPDVEDLLYLKMNNIQYATGYYKNNGLIVNKGSRLRLDINAITENMQNKIDRGRANNNIKDNVYINDIYYDTPSLAANIILGNHKNGWICWKNENGQTLDELTRKKDKKYMTLLKNKSKEIIQLFNILNNKILSIDEQIQIKINNNYFAYKVNRNFLELHVNKNSLLCYTVNGDLYKTNNMLEHVPESNGWTVDTKFHILDLNDIEKYWDVILDSYENTL